MKKSLLSLVSASVCLLALTPLHGSGFKWNQLPDMPFARSGAVAQVGNNLYLAGEGNSLNATRFAAFSFETRSFEELPTIPEKKAASAIAALDGEIYVISGNNHSSAQASSFAYSLESGAWRRIADFPYPRNLHRAVGLNGKVYVFGGDRAPMNTVQIYDPQTDTWSAGADMPTGRWSTGVCADGEEIWVVGGETEDGITPVVEIYNTATDSWRSGAPLRAPRADGAVFRLGEILHVAGGTAVGIAEKVHLDSMEYYDRANEEWLSVEGSSLPRQVVGAGVGTFGSQLVIMGGYSPWPDRSKLVYLGGNDPADADNDGLNDSQEMDVHGTDPSKFDSDGDGVDDYAEIFGFETDPVSGDAGEDETPSEEPSIFLLQPADVSGYEGESVTVSFSVRYSGWGSPGLVLWRGSENLSNRGAIVSQSNKKVATAGSNYTEADYSVRINGLTLEDATTWTVEVTIDGRRYSDTTSRAFSVTVDELSAPVFSTTPNTVLLGQGEPLTFNVEVSGSPVPDLQWYRNGKLIPDAVGSSYAIGALEPDDQGVYKVVATNRAGEKSSQEWALVVAGAGLHSDDDLEAAVLAERGAIVEDPSTVGLFSSSDLDAAVAAERSAIVADPESVGLHSDQALTEAVAAERSRIVADPASEGLFAASAVDAAVASERRSIIDNPSRVGLFSSQTVSHVKLGESTIERDGAAWELNWQLLQSDDLVEWSTVGVLRAEIDGSSENTFYMPALD